jgi:SAM-dependent methyltransferase
MRHQQPTDARVYYGERFWNEIPAVMAHLNRKITGRPDRDWADQSLAIMGRPAERALVLNCGNGLFDRKLIDRGVIRSAVGIDISAPLLAEAEAAVDGRQLEYQQMDVNRGDFPDGFDLVVNVAAGHHIACLDHVLRSLCALLPDDGWFISNDYVGPHRNQYPYEMWAAAWDLNERLPDGMRQQLTYPHLPTMLALDPTEAIHSELLLDTFHRYFTTSYFSGMGGGLAYLLLTHNDKVVEDPTPWEAEIARILDADNRCDLPPLFAFWAGQPRKAALDDPRLAEWTSEEEVREAAAARNGGEYYRRTLLQDLTTELSDQTIAADLEARAAVAAMESTWSWRLTRPLRAARGLARRG